MRGISVEPSPASTVVVVRQAEHDIEVLLLLRNTKLIFNGGHWVFPGGKIDAADYPDPDCRLEYHAAINAVVRETREEAGISIEATSLIHVAHWTTPEGYSRRYSTWFFVCPITDPGAIIVDDEEILDYRWITPRMALHASTTGELKLPEPTSQTLRGIQSYRSLSELQRAMQQVRIHVFPPRSEFYRSETIPH